MENTPTQTRSSEMHPLCKACSGACCETWAVKTPADPDESELVQTREMGRRDGISFLRCRCPHLTGDGLCSIQETKPKICVDFEPGGVPCLLVLRTLRPKLYQEVVCSANK